jgi:hypothetical protein
MTQPSPRLLLLVPLALTAAFAGPPRLTFVENRGQWAGDFRFLARAPGTMAWLRHDGITLRLERRDRNEGFVLRLRFEGASPSALLEGEERRPGAHSFFLGGDPGRWRTALPGWAAVRYRGLCAGTDLRVRDAGGRIEYDLLLDDAARAEGLVVRCEGITDLRVQDDGSLVLVTPAGELVQTAPVAWVEPEARPVACRYRRLGPDRFGFAVDAPAGSRLVIDPALVWSSYLGGSGYEWAYSAAHEPSGEVTVVGETPSSDFPVTPGVFDPSYNGTAQPTTDVFVSRFDATGTALVWSTYLGGSGGDKPYAVVGSGAGTVIVVGNASSSNFPTTAGVWDRTLGGSSDVFVTRLNATGSALLWSTYLGGGSGDVGNDGAVAADGSVVVTGVTSSSDFPVTPGAYQTGARGTSDVFVTRLNAAGSALVQSTRLGGGSGDVGKSVALDDSGAVTVSGVTSSGDFPVTPGAFQTTPQGPSDVFVSRLDPTLANLVWSTFLGGGSGDVGEGLAVDGAGVPTVTGVTSSSDFPLTPGAWQTNPQGSSDTFVTRLTAGGDALVWSTLVGGGSGDVGKAVTLDGTGAAVVSGQTSSNDYPTTPGAWDTTAGGSADGFVTRVDAAGASLLFSSFVGGGGSDGGEGHGALGANLFTVVGTANSDDFPTTPGAVQRNARGVSDAFVTTLRPWLAGVEKYGTATPACRSPLEIDASRRPTSGDPLFRLLCANAPPSSQGFLALALGRT